MEAFSASKNGQVRVFFIMILKKLAKVVSLGLPHCELASLKHFYSVEQLSTYPPCITPHALSCFQRVLLTALSTAVQALLLDTPGIRLKDINEAQQFIFDWYTVQSVNTKRYIVHA